MAIDVSHRLTVAVPLQAILFAAVCIAHANYAWAVGEQSAPTEDLTRLSLSDLANVEVTSVSKSGEGLQRAAASIYVISRDAILRSSATNVFEALRLAPNLLVTQLSASNYVVAARGFGGNPSAQNFANKLLILVDGRSVYSPLYSGIYSIALDVMLEDIDRIEVISGPGATLWGANAMNGVINIITRATILTTGSFVEAGAGNQEQALSGRYGGQAGENATFRVYGTGFHRAAMDLDTGASAHDGWSKGQGGFRYDWSENSDNVTVQGDLYRATQNEAGTQDGVALGGNVVARYVRQSEHSEFQLQAYADQSEQMSPAGGGGFVLNTYDIEFQHSIALGSANRLVWGAGERLNRYSITNAPSLLFVPSSRGLTLGNIFIQDTLSLAPRFNLIAGFKMEDDPYSGWSPLPDLRASWQFSDRATLWAAASRAIRSPTPFDTDVVEKLGPLVYLTGHTNFRPESLWSYEMGARAQASADLSLSATIFYNEYDDLRTVEPASATTFIPLQWGNGMQGDTFGFEAWATWQVNGWWRLSPSVTWLRERLTFKEGASELLGVAQAADDPSSHAALTSSMDLPHQITFDTSLRYVGALPSPALPHYYELDARFGWQVNRATELAVSGTNLLRARQQEFTSPIGESITRGVMAEARWKF
jgi:iron complex outermembrane recepter protein